MTTAAANRAPGEIDAEFVRHWSSRYPLDERERDLLDRVGPIVAERGAYHRDDLLAVGRWKSSRAIGYLGRNSDEDIEDITRAALAAPMRLKHRVLDLLSGVGVPMASAMLTIWNPTEFTIIDVRAIETLRAHGALGTGRAYFMPYLALCRDLAERSSCDLRTLDRALWQWSRERGSATDSDGADAAWTGDEAV